MVGKKVMACGSMTKTNQNRELIILAKRKIVKQFQNRIVDSIRRNSTNLSANEQNL